ncbi:MAG: Asp/Glu racemase [Actinomycetia bacterium]|nr:Asp/Glu racemase [Actinomycetes bacterium]
MRIGVLVPFTNTVLERDLRHLCPPGSTTYVTRIGGYGIDELPDVSAMAAMGDADIDDALELISGVNPDVVFYGCTSATLTHGLDFDRALRHHIGSATRALTITAAGALVFTLRQLDVNRIAFVSPYTRDVADEAITFMESAGFSTVGSAVPDGEVLSCDQGAFTPADIVELARRADHPEAETIVLSCTDLRAVEATPHIEEQLAKPVIAVNRAMFTELAARLPELGS